MNYFIGAFKKYADFNGRARRKEYWMFILFYIIFYIAAAIIDSVIAMPLATSIFSLALLVPSCSIAARRLHDIGRSGWWQLIILLPIIGMIILLVFLVKDSNEENDYGENPKDFITL